MAKGLSRKITYAQARSYDRTVPNGIGVTSIAAVNGRGSYAGNRRTLAQEKARAAKIRRTHGASAARAYMDAERARAENRAASARAYRAKKKAKPNPWVTRGDGKEEWIGPVRRKPYQGRGATFGEAAAWRTKTEWDRESVGGDPTSYQQAYEATRRQLLSKAKKNGRKTEANVRHYEDNKRGRRKGKRRQSKKQRAASLRNLKHARRAQGRRGGSRRGRKRGRSAAKGHKFGPFRAVSAMIGGKKRGTYAYRTTTGRLAHIPAWALAGGTSKKEVDAVWSGQITGPRAEKIMKRQQGIVARRARAAKRVTEHGDLFTPNDDGVKVISYDEWSKAATPNRRKKRKAGKRKGRKAAKRGRKYGKKRTARKSRRYGKRRSSRKTAKRGKRKSARRSSKKRTSKRGRRSSKRSTVPVGHARHALSDLRGFIRNSAGSYDDMVTYEDNKRGKRKGRKAAKRRGRKAGKRRSYKRRGQTAAQRRASLRNLKKAHAKRSRRSKGRKGSSKRRGGKGKRRSSSRKGSSRRKSSSRRRSSGKGKRHGVSKGSARKAWGTLKKYVGNRKHGKRYSRNPFSSAGFMDRLKGALKVGAVVAGGFMAHRAVSKLLNDNVTAKYLPASLTEYSGIISGLIVAAAALPLVEKVITKADTAALVTDGVWGSFIVGTAVAILNKLSQPTVAGYLSGYSVYDGRTRQYSGYGEYMEMKGMGEYMEMRGMGADYQAAAGYGADYQAAAGYGADFQAAAGMGADFQAAAGMGEYMATGAMGIGEYEAVRGLGAGPQYVREGIYPHQAEYALSVSEAASGIGDIGSQSTVLPGQVAEPVTDVPDSMRSGVFKSSDGIFGG